MQKLKTQARRTITKLTRLLRKTSASSTKQTTDKMGSLGEVDFGFPDEPLWNNLLKQAQTNTEPLINDTTLGAHITLAQLLYDVAHMRVALLQSLPADAFEPTSDGGKLLKASAPYVGLSTRPNYEFYVAVLAIVSIGGAIVPARIELDAEETLLVFRECNVTGLLAGPEQLPSSQHLAQLGASQNYTLPIIPLTLASLSCSSPSPPTITPSLFHINPAQTIPDPFPGVVIRTTGTTGTAKSVVVPRRIFYRTFGSFIPPDSLILIHENLDWTSGSLLLMMYILNGSRAEIVPTHPGPKFIWERLRQGGVTGLTSYAMFWEKLAEYYKREIAGLSEEERAPYVKGAQALKAGTAGSPPTPGLMRFWKETFGYNIMVGYVATELGEISLMSTPFDEYREGSMGREFAGATVKLSNGDHGEFLVKTGYLFMHYINNPERTRKAFTDDGFFKTGDYGHREGDVFFFDGRIGTDLIELGTELISLVHLDHALIVHPDAVSEHCVVNIPPSETSGQAALGILARFRDNVTEQAAQAIQEDLIRRVEERTHGKLAVRFRALGKGEEMPRTFNMKPFRRLVKEQYFS